MIPAHIHTTNHPRLTAISLLNYIRYLAEPRPPGLSVEQYEQELTRIHSTAVAAIRMLGHEPGPAGAP
jgi:hypothetical protein